MPFPDSKTFFPLYETSFKKVFGSKTVPPLRPGIPGGPGGPGGQRDALAAHAQQV